MSASVPGVYVEAEAVAVGVGDNIAEGDGLTEGDGLEDETGEAEVFGDGEGDGLGLIEGLGVALTEGLTEGFGVGLGEGVGVGVGSCVGEGDGEADSPKTCSLGEPGNNTDLTQIPDPVNIKTSKTPRDTVSFEGLLLKSPDNISALYRT